MQSSILTPSYFPVCLNMMTPTVHLKWAGQEISPRSLGNISTSTADLSLTILPQRSILTNSSDRSTWRQCSMKKAKGKKEGWKSNFEQYRGMGKNDHLGKNSLCLIGARSLYFSNRFFSIIF